MCVGVVSSVVATLALSLAGLIDWTGWPGPLAPLTSLVALVWLWDGCGWGARTTASVFVPQAESVKTVITGSHIGRISSLIGLPGGFVPSAKGLVTPTPSETPPHHPTSIDLGPSHYVSQKRLSVVRRPP